MVLFARKLWYRRNIFLFKISLLFFCFTLILYISTFILEKYNLYWRGYRSTSFIFIFFAIFSIISYWTLPVKNLLITIPSAFLIFFLTALSTLIIFEVVGDYQNQLFYDSSKYRLEDANRGFMAPYQLPKLFVKNGLFEKRYTIDGSSDNPSKLSSAKVRISKDKIIKIEVKEYSKDKVSILFYHSEDTNSIKKNPLEFIVDISDK